MGAPAVLRPPSPPRANHTPAAPRTPEELAAQAREAVEAGARSLHLPPYDDQGRQTLEAEPCAAALRAVRAACPGVPISLSTSAVIDPELRLALVATWTELPELATANQGEEGILGPCELLAACGIGIEADLLSLEDARLRRPGGRAALRAGAGRATANPPSRPRANTVPLTKASI